MGATTERMTVDDYYAITVVGDRKELVDGAIVVNDPKPVHMVLQTRIATALQVWTEGGPERGMAGTSTDVELDEHNLFNPDALWISEEHRLADLNEYPERVPDICVEIRSPSTWRSDMGKKKDAYERGGCPELWLVDHIERRVLVFRRSRPDVPTFDVEMAVRDELTSPQLPGFALSLERLFRDI